MIQGAMQQTAADRGHQVTTSTTVPTTNPNQEPNKASSAGLEVQQDDTTTTSPSTPGNEVTSASNDHQNQVHTDEPWHIRVSSMKHDSVVLQCPFCPARCIHLDCHLWHCCPRRHTLKWGAVFKICMQVREGTFAGTQELEEADPETGELSV
jgi:hypothetical protein